MFRNLKLEEELSNKIAMLTIGTVSELATWVSSYITDEQTENFSRGIFKRWDIFDKAIKKTYQELGCWGMKGKMGHFIFLLAGERADQIYAIYDIELTEQHKDIIRKNIFFNVEEIESHMAKLTWNL